MGQEAICHVGCRILQLRCRSGQLFEAFDSGVQVFLVEHLGAAEKPSPDRHEADQPPLGTEAVLRGLVRHPGH